MHHFPIHSDARLSGRHRLSYPATLFRHPDLYGGLEGVIDANLLFSEIVSTACSCEALVHADTAIIIVNQHIIA